MKEKRERLQSVKEYFQQKKVATLRKLGESIGCSERTVQRDLKQLDSIVSYTHRGHFITLEDIPKFDANGIWFYRGIGFTRHGNSLDLIVHIVNSSKEGMSREEIEEVTRIRVSQQIQDLLYREQLYRVKLGKRYIYIPEEAARNKKKRLRIIGDIQVEEHYGREVTVRDLIAVLKIVLQEKQIHMNSLKAWIKKHSLKIPLKKLEQLVARHKLDEKKTP